MKSFNLLIENITDIGWVELHHAAIDLGINSTLTNDIVSVENSIVVGSFEFFNKTKGSKINTCTLQNYNCLNYYKYVKDYLFNKDFVVMPVGYIRNSIKYLIDVIGEKKSKRIFIRPDSGAKSFSGMVFLNIDPYFDYDWSSVEKRCNPNDLCLLSYPKTIKEEYRFVIMDNEVVTGSLYKQNYDVKYEECNDKSIINFVRNIKDLYQPDNFFTIDVVIGDDNELYLLELNSFQHAGLYECNKEKILRKMLTTNFK